MMDRRRGRERNLVRKKMAVPVVDIGALVQELGTEPEDVDDDFDTKPLSSETKAAIDALHHVCKGGSGGLIAINHGFEEKVEDAIKAAINFHQKDKDFKEKYTATGIYDG